MLDNTLDHCGDFNGCSATSGGKLQLKWGSGSDVDIKSNKNKSNKNLPAVFPYKYAERWLLWKLKNGLKAKEGNVALWGTNVQSNGTHLCRGFKIIKIGIVKKKCNTTIIVCRVKDSVCTINGANVS